MLCLLLITALFFGGCTTQDGINESRSADYGSLIISTNNGLRADIFINGLPANAATPARIDSLIEGLYTLHLFYPHYDMVADALEVFVAKGQLQTITPEMVPCESGGLTISTDPSDARVSLNGILFGATPFDIVGLPANNYCLEIVSDSYIPLTDSIKIIINQTADITWTLTPVHTVLVEHFSNTNCPPCPEAEAVIKNVNAQFSDYRVLGIGYHTDFPSESDPLYLYSTAANDARIAYYNVTSAPAVFINGNYLPLMSYTQLENDLLAAIESAGTEVPGILLHRSKTERIGQSLFMEISVAGPDAANVTLFAALRESLVAFESAPGTNGQKEFEDVARAIQSGEKVGDNSWHFSFSINNLPDTDMSLVIWAQNREHVVMQTIAYALPFNCY